MILTKQKARELKAVIDGLSDKVKKDLNYRIQVERLSVSDLIIKGTLKLISLEEEPLDKEAINKFREYFKNKIAPAIKKKTKLEAVQKGNIRYGKYDFPFRIEVTEEGVDPAAEEWKKHAHLVGLTMQPGDKFQVRTKEYELKGLDPAKSKFPVLAADDKGKTYGFTIDCMQRIQEQQEKTGKGTESLEKGLQGP